ncbi:hypothetical protein K461DRAFT_292054 [Myriangium duriaei CBS 260.36]|uniref:Ribosomal protein bL31m N-terminal domain-containing protein n=1 Tax=Myriangium duriaei CBS 260.36 TaxID=1168546 RepID=A0A9P4MQ07_9PEZI|nr:hypothetical protein K461DRAFT_292054 [Myriangium duriaei CBS 260.36]
MSFRPHTPLILRSPLQCQVRHATLIRRPKRPYTFGQMVTLSDGSTFMQRTTSPAPIYRTSKDPRNSALWNPSSQKLANIEEDEAGRLARFRARFGRGWDAENTRGLDEQVEVEEAERRQEEEDGLLDLLSAGYGSGGAKKKGKK